MSRAVKILIGVWVVCLLLAVAAVATHRHWQTIAISVVDILGLGASLVILHLDERRRRSR